MDTQEQLRYVYGPVKSWRSGTSLGIDPIGKTSTCSFNCAYCQLGKIQNITTEIKEYVATATIINDLEELYKEGRFDFKKLDVITFAGSGEPTLASNLGESILAIKKLLEKYDAAVPISILTNATLLNNNEVLENVLKADQVSLKLDAPNDDVLRSINQAAEGVSVESIVSGIKKLQFKSNEIASDNGDVPQLGLQIMFMPKFINDVSYIDEMAKLIDEIGVSNIQINTPSRPKPVSKTGEYWIDTRGNHYGPDEKPDTPDFIEFTELPIISKEQAFLLEDKLHELTKLELDIINVYART